MLSTACPVQLLADCLKGVGAAFCSHLKRIWVLFTLCTLRPYMQTLRLKCPH